MLIIKSNKITLRIIVINIVSEQNRSSKNYHVWFRINRIDLRQNLGTGSTFVIVNKTFEIPTYYLVTFKVDWFTWHIFLTLLSLLWNKGETVCIRITQIDARQLHPFLSSVISPDALDWKMYFNLLPSEVQIDNFSFHILILTLNTCIAMTWKLTSH